MSLQKEGRAVMPRSSYSERDDTFGQLLLTLRTRLGLTQAQLGERLQVSVRAVGQWEAGESYPKAERLKEFIALALRQQAFARGQEAEEIRALWKAAHQKVLLDESWLAAQLSQLPGPSQPRGPSVAVSDAPAPRFSAPASGPLLDWGDALSVPSFYGREGELATLEAWLVQDRCRVVSVLGLGGIGKSALVVQAMQRLAGHFEAVIFRALRDAPSCETLLESCLQVLAPEALVRQPQDLSARLNILLSELGSRRVLLVLDNLEALLQEGDVRGQLRAGYEDYSRLLQGVAERAHASCLLLTSREKPAILRAQEGQHRPVRSLRLAGLAAESCEQLLATHELEGSKEERGRLIDRYEGNPLALNIVAQTIAELFGGQLTPFLAQDMLVFGSIADLLSEHWGRLSPLEQTLLYWLAILREPVSLEGLRTVLVAPLAPRQLLEAVDGLRRRSLVEGGQRAGTFTLQSVVLEYVSERLVSTAREELVQGQISRLREHGLSQAQAKEYVRQTQERLLLVPVLASLESVYQGRSQVEGRLRELLAEVRAWPEQDQGYGPANLVTLLRLLRGHLRDLDLSRLVLRGVQSQGVELQDANLAGALMRECVWTESFEAITAVAISPGGKFWAAASKRGEVRVWRVEQEAGQRLQWVWRAHTDYVWALAFSPDDRLLASGSLDGRVKLWDVESGALLWTGEHPGAGCLAFAPDGPSSAPGSGCLLASGGYGGTVRFWEPKRGTLLEEVPHPGAVFALAFSPDGRLLASGDFAGTIRLWERQHNGSARCVQTLEAHSHWVLGLVFAPEGSILASASYDGSVKLWDVGEDASLRMRRELVGHMQRVLGLAWSSDGGTLASSSGDQTIRLWEVEQGTCRLVLQGHTADVYRVAFTPDSRHLLSGSEDGTLRLWQVERGQCVRVLQGYDACLYDLDWSPDGTRLVSAGSDTVVALWEVESDKPLRVLRDHEWSVYGVAWHPVRGTGRRAWEALTHPDGSLFASSGWDNAIRLWDPTTGSCLQVIRDLDHSDTIFFGVAFSPDGKLLAGGTFMQGVLVWDVSTRSLRWSARTDSPRVLRLAWHPDGTRLVAGGEDGHVYVWDASDGRLLQRLAGHEGAVIGVAFSPDGTQLASGGDSQDGGELLVWDARSGERMYTRQRLTGAVYAVAWHPVGKQLITGGSDGRLCWWDLPSFECVREREAHQGIVHALKVSPDGRRLASCGNDGAIRLWELESGEHLHTLRRDRPYERLNITGIRGLTQAEIATLRALGAIADEADEQSTRPE
jgi:WD40 repeat protein/transcriptional regulator with XRE-family HTH domain